MTSNGQLVRLKRAAHPAAAQGLMTGPNATHRPGPSSANFKAKTVARVREPNRDRDAMNEITVTLDAIARGEPLAASELLPLVYDELRKVAAQQLAQEKPGQTLDPTALVHEAYLRLVTGGKDEGPRAGDPAGPIVDTFLAPPPRRCAVFWSRMPAARGAKSMAADDDANTRTSTP
jgi:hypothetical protein